MNPMFFGQNGAGAVIFADDFNRANADDPGANWQEQGDADIVSNTLRFPSTSGGRALWKTPTGGATQWVKFTVSWTGSGNYFGPYFRLTGTSAGSTGYSLSFDEAANGVAWYNSTVAGSDTAISSGAALTVATGDTFGVTVQGLGTSTIVRLWRNPTGTPISSGNWNGDSSPDVTFTTNPSPARDNGLYVGLWGAPDSSSNNLSMDNFSAGNCPD